MRLDELPIRPGSAGVLISQNGGTVRHFRFAITSFLFIAFAAGGCGADGGGGSPNSPPADPPPVITTTTLPDAPYGTAYLQILQFTGSGTGTWVLDSDSLPAGLVLASNGAISGNPEGPDGTSVFTVKVVTPSGSDTQILSILVSGSPAPGTLIPGFASDGVLLINPGSGYDLPFALAQDGTSFYVGGRHDIGMPNTQWRVEKRGLSDGALASAFGTAGVFTYDYGLGDELRDLALGGGGLFAAGDVINGNTWRLAKLDSTDASFDGTFGTGGAASGQTYVSALVVAAGSLYVIGQLHVFDPLTSSSQPHWTIQKRSLTDGSLDPAFGTSGVLTDSFVGSPTAATADSTGLYVVGGDTAGWRIQKRSLVDGSLISGFGTAGNIAFDTGMGSDVPYRVATDSTGLYVVGADASPGNLQWRIEKRGLTDGALVSSFGTAGVVTFNPSTGADIPYTLAVDGPSLYVAGGDMGPGDAQWRIEKRSSIDGSPVGSFGTGGVVTVNPSASNYEEVRSLLVVGSRILMTGADWAPGNPQWRIELRQK